MLLIEITVFNASVWYNALIWYNASICCCAIWRWELENCDWTRSASAGVLYSQIWHWPREWSSSHPFPWNCLRWSQAFKCQHFTTHSRCTSLHISSHLVEVTVYMYTTDMLFWMAALWDYSCGLQFETIDLLTYIIYCLDYCNSLLTGVNEGLLWRLQSVQNGAARLVRGTRRCEHITPALRQLHWLPVCNGSSIS